MLFIDEINKQTQDKYGIRFKSATLERESGSCFVELFYKDGVILTAAARKDLEQKIVSMLPSGFDYKVKFIKNFVVDEAVEAAIKKFLKSNFPSVIFDVVKVDCEGENKSCKIDIDADMMGYASDRKIASSLEDALFGEFNSKISVELGEKEPEQLGEPEPLPAELFEQPEQEYIEVGEVQPLVGEMTDNLAIPIKYKTGPEENAVICGKISFIVENSFEPKKKDRAEDKGEKSEEGAVKKYFRIGLEDYSGKMTCVYFTSSKTYPVVAELKKGEELIVGGRLSENNFSGSIDMKIKTISRCKIPEHIEPEAVFKSEPAEYRNVFPEPVEYYAQEDLFSQGEKKLNKFFLENDIVVYDFETTGTRVDGSDKIVEIGAVKVVKGKITESFSCLINPEMPIPADATKVHGIRNEDVAGKPTYQQVMGDFYKFTRGCYLAGYNIIGFDNIYLSVFGRKCMYNFDNPVIDVYKLAQRGVRGVKNYKLGTIAEKLGVSLDHAHRAVFDTIATAEVLFKLGDMMEIV